MIEQSKNRRTNNLLEDTDRRIDREGHRRKFEFVEQEEKKGCGKKNL